jgi:hypothetical protein
MSKRNQRFDSALSRTLNKLQQQGEAYRHLHHAYTGLNAGFKELRTTHAKMTKRLQEKKEELLQQQRLADNRQIEIDHLKHNLQLQIRVVEGAHRDQAAMADMLAKRTAELEAARSFFPQAESVTDTRVVELVQELNYEIAQTAACLAEAYDHVERRHTHIASCTASTGVPLQDLVGQRFIDMLQITHPLLDPTDILQAAIQACLASLAVIAIHDWSFCKALELDDMFDKLLTSGDNSCMASKQWIPTLGGSRVGSGRNKMERLVAQVCESCVRRHIRRVRRHNDTRSLHGRCHHVCWL